MVPSKTGLAVQKLLKSNCIFNRRSNENKNCLINACNLIIENIKKKVKSEKYHEKVHGAIAVYSTYVYKLLWSQTTTSSCAICFILFVWLIRWKLNWSFFFSCILPASSLSLYHNFNLRLCERFKFCLFSFNANRLSPNNFRKKRKINPLVPILNFVPSNDDQNENCITLQQKDKKNYEPAQCAMSAV